MGELIIAVTIFCSHIIETDSRAQCQHYMDKIVYQCIEDNGNRQRITLCVLNGQMKYLESKKSTLDK